MKAITIRQPWASAISHGTKRVENRTWVPSNVKHGEMIAIHAGLSLDKESVDGVRVVAPNMPAKLPRGVIVAVATYGGAVNPLERKSDIWAFGPHCLLLRDVIALEHPVKVKGSLGFWNLPAEIEEALINQLELIRGAK